MDSVDKGYEVGFEQGMRERDAVVVPMLPYREDNIRAILGQVGTENYFFAGKDCGLILDALHIHGNFATSRQGVGGEV